mmetsp:Transcript_36974/g.73175  ORF Transcript_36974/g.73175 Transcript_36974/m.73175 type:complete len:212 (+) Transcript_36974:1475-2110(+)
MSAKSTAEPWKCGGDDSHFSAAVWNADDCTPGGAEKSFTFRRVDGCSRHLCMLWLPQSPGPEHISHLPGWLTGTGCACPRTPTTASSAATAWTREAGAAPLLGPVTAATSLSTFHATSSRRCLSLCWGPETSPALVAPLHRIPNTPMTDAAASPDKSQQLRSRERACCSPEESSSNRCSLQEKPWRHNVPQGAASRQISLVCSCRSIGISS